LHTVLRIFSFRKLRCAIAQRPTHSDKIITIITIIIITNTQNKNTKEKERVFFSFKKHSGIEIVLDKISYIRRHLLDLRLVKLLQLTESADIIARDKIDRHTLATKAAGTTDAMDIVFEIAR